MATAIVAGLSQADILAAVAAAGESGRVIFPDGTYPVDGLTAMVADQTWELERRAVLARQAASAAPILNITAPGLRLIGGTLDGGAPVQTGVQGVGLEAEDVAFRNIAGWGLIFKDCPLVVRRCTLTDIAYAAVFWHTDTVGAVGPTITDSKIVYGAGYVSQAAIIIHGQSGNDWLSDATVCRNWIDMPAAGDLTTANGVDIWNCYRARVQDNLIRSGHSPISLGYCMNSIVTGNNLGNFTTYGVEVAAVYGKASRENLIEGNMMYGKPPNALAGVKIIGSHDNLIVGNRARYCTDVVSAVNGSTGNLIANNL